MASSIPPNPPSNPSPQSESLAAETHRNRCEISPKVRIIAQRTQHRMFQRTGLFFNEATFQVPNTVHEAFENMHLGTSDLDKNDPHATAALSDLYLISWSNTQFFSAQMAGLGFRFISCNLRKKPGLKQPPAVEKWLRLERLPAPPARRPPPNAKATLSRAQVTPASAQTIPAPTPTPTQAARASTRTTPAPQTTPASATPHSRVQNTPQPSTAPPPSQSLKRPQPPQPSSDRVLSPPNKIQRGPSEIRAPSQPSAQPPSQPPSQPPPPPKRNVISSSNKPPHDSARSSVPIIDLT